MLPVLLDCCSSEGFLEPGSGVLRCQEVADDPRHHIRLVQMHKMSPRHLYELDVLEGEDTIRYGTGKCSLRQALLAVALSGG